jgi:hypothetical protein
MPIPVIAPAVVLLFAMKHVFPETENVPRVVVTLHALGTSFT